MLHYQVESDSPDGATSNSKMSELGYYRHVHYTLALMCAKKSYNYRLQFARYSGKYTAGYSRKCRWASFFGPPCNFVMCNVTIENIIFLGSGGHVLLIDAKFL